MCTAALVALTKFTTDLMHFDLISTEVSILGLISFTQILDLQTQQTVPC